MLGSLLPFQNKTLCLFFVLSLVALCLSAQQQTPIQNKTLVVFSFLNKENENQNLLDTHKNLISIGVDAVNYMSTHPTHVVVVIVVADVGDMTDPLAASKNFVEAAGVVQVSWM